MRTDSPSDAETGGADAARSSDTARSGPIERSSARHGLDRLGRRRARAAGSLPSAPRRRVVAPSPAAAASGVREKRSIFASLRPIESSASSVTTPTASRLCAAQTCARPAGRCPSPPAVSATTGRTPALAEREVARLHRFVAPGCAGTTGRRPVRAAASKKSSRCTRCERRSRAMRRSSRQMRPKATSRRMPGDRPSRAAPTAPRCRSERTRPSRRRRDRPPRATRSAWCRAGERVESTRASSSSSAAPEDPLDADLRRSGPHRLPPSRATSTKRSGEAPGAVATSASSVLACATPSAAPAGAGRLQRLDREPGGRQLGCDVAAERGVRVIAGPSARVRQRLDVREDSLRRRTCPAEARPGAGRRPRWDLGRGEAPTRKRRREHDSQEQAPTRGERHDPGFSRASRRAGSDAIPY